MKKLMMILIITTTAVALVFAGGGSQSKASSLADANAPQEISVEVFNRGSDGGKTDPTNNSYTDWIKQKVLKDEGIKVTFIAVGRNDETEALTNMMAAGNPPDICFTYDEGLVASFRNAGGLYNMGSNLGRLMPDLEKFLGPDPMIPGRGLIRRYEISGTGEVYSIPARVTSSADYNTFIRKDWLDKLGLALPKTKQQYYEALKAFKEKDPGNVGKDKVISVTTGRGIWYGMGQLINSFIDPNMSRKDEWVNYVAQRNFLFPGYKEGVRFVNKMFNEGLIDKDFPLYSSDDNCWNLLKSGIAGSYLDNWDQMYRDTPGVLKDLKVNIPTAEIVSIDCFEDANGVTTKYVSDVTGVNFFIPKKSTKNPEAAMRYLNWLIKTENLNFLQLGPEGIGWNMVNGLPISKPITGPWIQNSLLNIDYTIPVNGLELGDSDKNLMVQATSYNCDPQLILDAFANATRNGKVHPVLPVVISHEETYQETLQTLGDSIMAEAVMCRPADFDKVWDAGIQRWLATGADAIRKERAEKYFE
jgi:putative aldouronate transport system substrate-binding protein